MVHFGVPTTCVRIKAGGHATVVVVVHGSRGGADGGGSGGGGGSSASGVRANSSIRLRVQILA